MRSKAKLNSSSTVSKAKTRSPKKKPKEAEVDSKVREIISKSAQKGINDDNQKKESKAFTLDDVRSILSTKAKDSKANKAEAVKKETVKKASTKKSSSKVKKLTTASIDDILGFADIGNSVDQPVKTYSSGMFVRLAFAVNIMSDPKIMVIDEALAVGDMRFQAKCITALKRIQNNGTTVLFVSHDIGSVQNLCSRGIYLEQGKLISIGAAPKIAEEYRDEPWKDKGYVAYNLWGGKAMVSWAKRTSDAN